MIIKMCISVNCCQECRSSVVIYIYKSSCHVLSGYRKEFVFVVFVPDHKRYFLIFEDLHECRCERNVKSNFTPRECNSCIKYLYFESLNVLKNETASQRAKSKTKTFCGGFISFWTFVSEQIMI